MKRKQEMLKIEKTVQSNMVELVEFKKGKNEEKMREARERYKTAMKERESNNRAFLIKHKSK